MSLNYTKIAVQLGAVLKVSQKVKAALDHARKANNSTYNARLFTAANGYDQTVTAEKRAYGEQVDFFDKTMVPSLVTMFTGYRKQVEKIEDFFGVLALGLAISEGNFGKDAISYEYDKQLLQDGQVLLVSRGGILGQLDRDMRANGIYVDANVMTLGSFTADNGNRGEVSVSSLTALSQVPTGTLVFECVDEAVDQCHIAVRVELPSDDPMPDGDTVIPAENFIVPEKSFEDYFLGLTGVLLVRPGLASPTKVGDSGSMITSSGTFTTPAERDMAGGVLQVRVTRRDTTGEEWLIEFFSDSSRKNKVGAVVTGTLTGTVTLTAQLRGRTQFVFDFDRAAADSALVSPGDVDDTISFNIRTPRKGDRWTRTVTNDEQYNFVTKIKRMWRWTPPTSGSSKMSNAAASSETMT